jgi:hypothetical protein
MLLLRSTDSNGHYRGIVCGDKVEFACDNKVCSSLLFAFLNSTNRDLEKEPIAFNFYTSEQLEEILSSQTLHVASSNISAMILSDDELLIIQIVRDVFLDANSPLKLQLSLNKYIGERKQYSKNVVLNIYELSKDGYARAFKDMVEHSLAKPIEIR